MGVRACEQTLLRCRVKVRSVAGPLPWTQQVLYHTRGAQALDRLVPHAESHRCAVRFDQLRHAVPVRLFPRCCYEWDEKLREGLFVVFIVPGGRSRRAQVEGAALAAATFAAHQQIDGRLVLDATCPQSCPGYERGACVREPLALGRDARNDAYLLL